MAQLTIDEVLALEPRITLSAIERMKVWPTLPLVPISGIKLGRAYVARKSDNRNLFWQGKGHWMNIQYPERGTPKVVVPMLHAGAFTSGFDRIGHRRNIGLYDGYLSMPVVPASEWVCVGTAIRLQVAA